MNRVPQPWSPRPSESLTVVTVISCERFYRWRAVNRSTRIQRCCMLRARARNKGLFCRILTIEVGCTDKAVDVPRLAVNTHLLTACPLLSRSYQSCFSFFTFYCFCPIVVHLFMPHFKCDWTRDNFSSIPFHSFFFLPSFVRYIVYVLRVHAYMCVLPVRPLAGVTY